MRKNSMSSPVKQAKHSRGKSSPMPMLQLNEILRKDQPSLCATLNSDINVKEDYQSP